MNAIELPGLYYLIANIVVIRHKTICNVVTFFFPLLFLSCISCFLLFFPFVLVLGQSKDYAFSEIPFLVLKVFVVREAGDSTFQRSHTPLSASREPFLGWDETPWFYTCVAMTSQKSCTPCDNKLTAHCEVASVPMWGHDNVTFAVSPVSSAQFILRIYKKAPHY